MKISLKNTPEQVELIKAIGSKNTTVSREAGEAFAAFLGPVVQQVLQQAATANQIFTDAPFDEDDSPSYPLDLYYQTTPNHVQVWSQTMAGGLPSSQVTGMQELKIATYRLDSAVSFGKAYARKARLDIISKAIERMAQEILVKQERNAWAVVLKALAEASTNSVKHAFGSASASDFTLALLSNLMTRAKRINESWASGSPAAAFSNGMTDLYVSPEVKGDIRSFSFNAVTNSNTDLPSGVREEIYRSAGSQEIFGVVINELMELGVGKKYNTLFDTLAGSTSYTNFAGASGATFASTDELIVGVDKSKGAFIRPVARQSESGNTFVAIPDDQYNVSRADKAGFYGSLEEGRVCIDARAVVGIILKA